MDFKKYCLAIIGAVLIATSASAIELPDGAVSVFASLYLSPAGQETESEILYHITSHLSFDGSDRFATFFDLENTAFDDFAWVINAQEYPYLDLQTLHLVRYLGRDRKEPFIWLPKDGSVEIDFVEAERTLRSRRVSVPPEMPPVSVTPAFRVTEENTHEEYFLDWASVHAGSYSFMVSYRSDGTPFGGRGNSVGASELLLGSEYLSVGGEPAKYLGLEVNTESRAEERFGIFRIRIVIQGPRPWSVEHEKLEESYF